MIYLEIFIFLFLTFIFFYFLLRTILFIGYSQNGTQFFEMDYYTRKIKTIKWGFKSRNIFFNYRNKNKWVKEEKFLSHFSNSKYIRKKFNEILDKINQNEKEMEFSFYSFVKTFIKKQENFYFKVTIFFSEENSNYFIKIKWNKKNNKTKQNNKIKKIQIWKLQKNNKKFQGIISFNLKSYINNNGKIILLLLSNFFQKKWRYFYIDEKICFVLFSNYEKQTQLKIKKIIKKLNKNLIKTGINYIFSGSSYIVQKNNKKSFYKKNQLINFLIYKSISNKKNFISINDIEFNKKEYLEFNKNNNLLNFAIKNNQVQENFFSVKNSITKRIFIKYYFPTIKNTNILDKLILNVNNKIKLFNYFAKEKAFSKKNTKFLINIYGFWLIKNENKKFNPNIIYIVNLIDENNYSRIFKSILKLQKKGIKFGIQIKDISKMNYFLVMQNINFQFIFLDKNNSKIEKEKTEIYVQNILKISQNQKIKFIYEEKPKWLHLKTHISSKLYYLEK